MNKTIILGLDGLSLDEIQKRDLPNFERIMNKGFYGKLRSTFPPITCPAWISMFTGKSSGQLGLFDFFTLTRNYKKRALDLTEIFKGGYLWDLAEKGGYKSGVIAVPMVSPYETAGFMVGDWESNSDENFRGIELDLSCIENSDWILTSTKLKEGIENFRKEIEILDEILDRDEDIIISVFQLSDEVIHYGNTDRSFGKVYRTLDEGVGKILNKVEENNWNLIIVSDHGAKKVHNRFNLNNWLEENGYLKFKGKIGLLTRISDFISRYNTNLVRVGMRIFERITDFFGSEEVETSQKMALGKIDFGNTEAFSVSTSVGEISGIWLNTKGKFNNGTVGKGEAEKIKNEIKDKLKRERAVKDVWKRDEILNAGDLNFDLPDLVVRVAEDFLIGYRPMPNVHSKRRRYIHDFYGTLMGTGPDLMENGFEVSGAVIKDMTPTVLHMLGLPIPKDMDGEVLDETITSKEKRKIKYCAATGVNKTQDMTEEDEEKLKRKLRELGYNA